MWMPQLEVESRLSVPGDGVGRNFHCFSQREGGAQGEGRPHNEASVLASASGQEAVFSLAALWLGNPS